MPHIFSLNCLKLSFTIIQNLDYSDGLTQSSLSNMGTHQKMNQLFLYADLYFSLFLIQLILTSVKNAFVFKIEIIMRGDGTSVLSCQRGSSQNVQEVKWESISPIFYLIVKLLCCEQCFYCWQMSQYCWPESTLRDKHHIQSMP